MKTVISILIVLLSAVRLDAQSTFNTDKHDSTNVYYFSLIKYCEYLQKSNISQDETVIIEYNYLFSDILPSELLGYHITYVSIDKLKVILKYSKNKEVTFVRIIPIQLEGSDLVINVIPFAAKYDNKQIEFINSGGIGIYFEFDCNKRNFRFKTTKRGYI